MFLINSRDHLIFETAQSSHRKDVHPKRCTFSRSYGANLPSSFTRVISHALVFSTCPPVSVCGTVRFTHNLEAFLGSLASMTSTLTGLPITSQINSRPDFPKQPTYRFRRALPIARSPSLLRHPFECKSSTGIFACFPSTTPFGLALGADSPYADERCVGNLGLPAGRSLTCLIVTHVSIRTSDTSTDLSKPASTAYRTLFYHHRFRNNP